MTTIRWHTRVRALLVSALIVLPAAMAGHAEGDRPASWAQPVEGRAGLGNFFKVSDELYRGAQPEDGGFAELAELGVKTVVNLRTFHSDSKECQRAGLRHVHIPMQAWRPEDDDVVAFLRVITDADNQPVFVHCLHGSDRTGLMTAVYRIAVQGWSKEDALQEMTEGGYGFHSMWENLVEYLRDCDVDALMARGGCPNEAPPADAE